MGGNDHAVGLWIMARGDFQKCDHCLITGENVEIKSNKYTFSTSGILNLLNYYTFWVLPKHW